MKCPGVENTTGMGLAISTILMRWQEKLTHEQKQNYEKEALKTIRNAGTASRGTAKNADRSDRAEDAAR